MIMGSILTSSERSNGSGTRWRSVARVIPHKQRDGPAKAAGRVYKQIGAGSLQISRPATSCPAMAAGQVLHKLPDRFPARSAGHGSSDSSSCDAAFSGASSACVLPSCDACAFCRWAWTLLSVCYLAFRCCSRILCARVPRSDDLLMAAVRLNQAFEESRFPNCKYTIPMLNAAG